MQTVKYLTIYRGAEAGETAEVDDYEAELLTIHRVAELIEGKPKKRTATRGRGRTAEDPAGEEGEE